MRRGPRQPLPRVLSSVAGVFALAVAVALLASCRPAPSALEQIRKRGELRVVTLNLPTCYYLGSQGTEGLGGTASPHCRAAPESRAAPHR